MDKGVVSETEIPCLSAALMSKLCLHLYVYHTSALKPSISRKQYIAYKGALSRVTLCNDKFIVATSSQLLGGSWSLLYRYSTGLDAASKRADKTCENRVTRVHFSYFTVKRFEVSEETFFDHFHMRGKIAACDKCRA